MHPEPTTAEKKDAAVSAADLPVLQSPPSSLWQDAWHRLTRNFAAMAGLCFFVFILLFSLLGPFLTPYSQEQQERSLQATPPLAAIAAFEEIRENGKDRTGFVALLDLERDLSRDRTAEEAEALIEQLREEGELALGDTRYSMSNRLHLLGTDGLGRDLLTRLMYGGRVSLAVGFVAALVALIVGVIYGATAGYLGGKTDSVMMRIVDIMYSLPFTIFVILLMVVFGRNIFLIFVAIGAVNWLDMARIVRGQTLSLKNKDFIEAARVSGATEKQIITRHIVPNLLGVVAVYVSLTIPQVILVESFLSFLGLGVQEPLTSWGALVNEGAQELETAPWSLLFPAVFLALTLFSFNFLGDGLRDALDPRDR